MSEPNEKLLALFAANRQKKEDALSDAEKRERDEKRDLDSFKIFSDEVIAPELEKLAAFVRQQGWDAKVLRPNKVDGLPKLNVPAIGIYFSEQGQVSEWTPEQYAYVLFRVVPGHFKVSISESTIMPGRGGSSSSGTSIEMNKLNAQLIRSRVEDLLTRLLR